MCRLYNVFVSICTLYLVLFNFKTIFLHSIDSKQYRERKWLTARAVSLFMVCLSFLGWSFLLWSFHISYVVIDDTCYILFAIISFTLLQSSCCNSWDFFVELLFRALVFASFPRTFKFGSRGRVWILILCSMVYPARNHVLNSRFTRKKIDVIMGLGCEKSC